MLELLQVANSVYRHEGKFDGSSLTVTYAVNRVEHEARMRSGRREIADEFLLAALLSVPDERLGSVSRRFERVFRKPDNACFASVVEDPEGGLWAQRRAQPVVDVLGIEIRTTSLKRGYSIAHRWAGYGPRTVQISAVANVFELTEASHYGIGLRTIDGECLMAPAAFVSERWSSARWRFAELVYGQYCALQG